MKKTYLVLLLPTVLTLLLSGCLLLRSGDTRDGSDTVVHKEAPGHGETELLKVDPKEVEPKESEAVADVKKVYIGISDFEILNDDPALSVLAKDIPQTLTRVFIDSWYIKAVDRQQFDKIFEEIKLSMSGISDEKTAVEAGKIIGAEYILLGSFLKLGEQVKITCRMVRTETSEIVYTENVRGNFQDLFDLEEELADKIEAYIKNLDEKKA